MPESCLISRIAGNMLTAMFPGSLSLPALSFSLFLFVSRSLTARLLLFLTFSLLRAVRTGPSWHDPFLCVEMKAKGQTHTPVSWSSLSFNQQICFIIFHFLSPQRGLQNQFCILFFFYLYKKFRTKNKCNMKIKFRNEKAWQKHSGNAFDVIAVQ